MRDTSVLSASDSGDTTALVVVNPSEIRLYAYCPRLLFFREHLGARRSLALELRALIGRLYHIILGFIALLRGFKVELSLEEKLGSVVLRGRPDYYRIEEERAEVVEAKSSRGPPEGVWLSDLLQVTAYGFILARRGARRVDLVVRYADGARRLELTPELSVMMLKSVDDIVMVKKHGVLPVALRSEAKCEKCLYREECYSIDENLEAEGDLDEPGEWLKNVKRVYAILEE
ncbi:MAG: CRISPR-associated protein Cas4 [Acidilobaceae archaeon]